MFAPQHLPLRLPIGAPFPVDVIDATPSLSRYVIRVRVSRDTWSTIDELELFNLVADARKPGSLTGSGDVEIELRLVDALVPDVIRRVAGLDPVDGVAELAELGDEAPALITESWFATNVTEQVPLPDDLADSGELRQGFSTRWADADQLASDDAAGVPVEEVIQQPIDPATEPWPPLLGQIRNYLDESDIAFERHAGANMVSANIGGENGSWSLWLHTREDTRQVVAYSIRPVDIDVEHRPQVAEFITRLNSKMFSGAFELDLDTGGFRCRTSLSLGDAPLSDDLIRGLIEPNSLALDAALAGLDAVLSGVSPTDAVRMHPPVT
ncbi:YbjN domain-containing protein [Ilumatobacter coccineus]|uniref:YbjN domain-containing protein n=1 Tax=Ilumatobacter coccineus (strain NBRC 103263 / KCTC 29153 / YM16-304) TaxID=1313172 RepID=A0A6C7E012_ILUCY|nr:YbjN domain-containing protein [Ilumatobacter coccineus]BAN00381.1 hypothetical protein YM304_00670 [Ilumatobacter coccineus YM16-304]